MMRDNRRVARPAGRRDVTDDGQLRVLTLHWGFVPGGVVKYAMALDQVGAFAPVRMRHAVIYAHAWDLDQEALDRLDPVRITIRSRADPSWLRRFEMEIERFEPHLLLTFGFNGNVIAWLHSALWGSCPAYVSVFHGAYYAPGPGRRLVAPVMNTLSEAFLRRRACSIAAVSRVSKDYLVARGIPADKIVVIHNGLSDEWGEPAARRTARIALGLLEDDLAVGVASRLDPIKGLPSLLEAMVDLFPSVPKLKLVIIGTGPLEAKLRRQVAASGYQDRVRFTGFRSDAARLLSGLDIFALPSLQENHSIGLLEAMRAGLAIVTTAVGGNLESVRDGREALVVPSADAVALRDALRQLTTNPRLRRRLGAAARHRFLTEFTVERMLQQTAAWLIGSAEGPSWSKPTLVSSCGS